ncbi:recombination directionality factor [Streptomyces chryseus]|uniref:Uncharacterized protein n=1 Tax=Streptomyces chryseus TaxID=68186 RepID=A0ABQ3E4H9_9ACTN|nr:hypothetical protein [Streptomyces chryseus]GHB24530.1 hypothetical protein GCM10010346_55360 [Streptomyces chryseus]
MTQSAAARAGRFHTGRLSKGLPQALDAWRVTTDDADVAVRVAGFLGGEPRPNEGTGGTGPAYEVMTSRESVHVLLDGPDAVAAHMVLRGSTGIIHECDGVEFLSPEEKRGQPCGCPPLLEDRKLAARDGRGPMPSVDITFRIAAAPGLGAFHFMTHSWQMAAQLSHLTDALERVNGPAICDLTLELVVYTTKAGRGVCYRKPVVTVLGSPYTVAPEPQPTAEPTPAPAGRTDRRHREASAPRPGFLTHLTGSDRLAVITGSRGRLVSVLVSFTSVRECSDGSGPNGPTQARTDTAPSGRPYEHLESVLGATPHEFESRILRSRLTRRNEEPGPLSGRVLRHALVSFAVSVISGIHDISYGTPLHQQLALRG